MARRARLESEPFAPVLWFLALTIVGGVDGGAASSEGYEDKLITWGLAQQGLTRDDAPDGKPVERIVVAHENVFSPTDPFPTWLNVFHWKTKESIVRREVLFEPGARWSAELVAETERNLRRISVLAVARLVAAVGERGGVVAVVVAKDRWSLRLNNDFTLIGPLLQFLRLQLTEINFRGLSQQLSADFVLRLDTVALGQTFIERRLFGSRWSFGETASVIFNRTSFAPEGTSGALALSLPLVSLDQPWGFTVRGDWNLRRRRVFRGASIWALPYQDEQGTTAVPFVYDVTEVRGDALVTRSFGSKLKADVSYGGGAYVRRYVPPTDGLTQAQRDWLVQQWLPRTETATHLTGLLRLFPADYRVLRDLESFELSEDYQLGPFAQASARWAFPTPWLPTHFLELAGAVRYRALAWDDLFTASVAASVRLRPGAAAANQRLVAELLNYSPRFFGGRLVTRAIVDLKVNDLDNRQVLLGGSTGLRGAFPEQLSGRHYLLANVEYRTRSFEVATFAVGFALFYDVGTAFTDAVLPPTHTVGAGLRLLLPQFNVEVIRIDFGVAIGGAAPGLDRLNATFGQITSLRPDFLDDPMGLGGRLPP